MSVIKSLVIAFSMYSKIPMPHLELEEKDMRYVMGFFPLAGLVIGAVIYGWVYTVSYTHLTLPTILLV